MKKILIAYATRSGSTAEVAQAIGQELAGDGVLVEARPIRKVDNLDGYDAVIVGGPMIMGWHAEAVQFVQRHQQTLSRLPVAYFLTALSLTQTANGHVDGLAIYQDPTLAKPPKNEQRPSYKERYASVPNYLAPVLKKAPNVRPVSVGFFNGKLDAARLDLFSRLFVTLVVGAQSGDYRNWQAIRTWAAGLRPALLGEQEAAR